MKLGRVLLLALAAVFVFSCSNNPKKLIVGKWKDPGAPDSKGYIEITKTDFVIRGNDRVIKRQYKFVGKDEIELAESRSGKEEGYKVLVNKKYLVLIEEDGDVDVVFERQ